MPRKKSVDAGNPGLEVEVVIPVQHTRRARRWEGGGSSTQPPRRQKRRPRMPRITRLLALAIKFEEMIARGEVRDYADIARLGYITRARASQIMNLTLLAPDIQEVLLEMTEENEVTERDVRAATKCASWGAQREVFGRLLAPRQGELA